MARTVAPAPPQPQPLPLLELYCLVLGDSSKQIFPVKIASTETVGTLKKAIKEEKPHAFRDVDADKLALWSVSFPTEPDEVLQEKLEKFEAHNENPLKSLWKLSNLFPTINDDVLHVLIGAHTGEYSDIQAMYLDGLHSGSRSSSTPAATAP